MGFTGAFYDEKHIFRYRVLIANAEVFTNSLKQAKYIKRTEKAKFIDYYDKKDCCWRPLRQKGKNKESLKHMQEFARQLKERVEK